MRTEYNAFNASPVQWVVVNTHPHKEAYAIEQLERQEFRTYCPLMRKRLQRARKPRDVLRPLFPGYVFVQVAADRQKWRPILSTFGVRTLIRFGERLATLDHAFIQNLKSREIDGVVSHLVERPNVGDSYRLSGGPFDGVVVKILSLDDKDRLTVLMDLLNQQVRVHVEARHLGLLVET